MRFHPGFGTAALARRVDPPAALRSPRRITVTVPYRLYLSLVDRSDQEGRSLSNLAAFLLEQCCGSCGSPWTTAGPQSARLR